MKASTFWLFLRLFFVSFYIPIGFALVPAIAFIPIGLWGNFNGGCSGLSGCFINPLLNIYGDQTFTRLLMLFWVIGLAMVLLMTYQAFKSEIQENSASPWRWLIALGNMRRRYINSFFRAWMRAVRPKRKPVDSRPCKTP